VPEVGLPSPDTCASFPILLNIIIPRAMLMYKHSKLRVTIYHIVNRVKNERFF
jgi:hypothetical protein